MSKKYFIMNNRENPHDGYKEVSEEFVKNYIKSFPNGERAYFINLGYAIMETDEAGYRNFYKEYRRERYIEEEAHRAGLVSLNAIDSEELDGTSVVVDTSEPFEERIQRKLIIEKIFETNVLLSDEDKELVKMLYFDGMSERQVTGITGIARTTLNYRRNRILKKISNYLEN